MENRVYPTAILILSLIILSVIAAPAHSQEPEQPPVLAGGRTGADTHFEQLWPTILDRQLLYHAVHGRFFQGFVTHGAIPDGVLPEPLDRGTWHPSDQPTDWLEFFGAARPSGLPYALKLDTYESATGDGFIAVVYVREGADIYSRSIDIGPEEQYSDWQLLQ